MRVPRVWERTAEERHGGSLASLVDGLRGAVVVGSDLDDGGCDGRGWRDGLVGFGGLGMLAGW